MATVGRRWSGGGRPVAAGGGGPAVPGAWLWWLNYLRPDLRRSNITVQEQLLIPELHPRWSNRLSKIAQHLPGCTDNEIKNYWRTWVQKHARPLNCNVNSQQFKDLMRYLWMPCLLERISSSSGGGEVGCDAAPWPVNNVEVELSCTTVVSSSSSVSTPTDGTQQHDGGGWPAVGGGAVADSAVADGGGWRAAAQWRSLGTPN